MRLVIQTATLAKALHRVQGVAGRRGLASTSGVVLLEANASGLTIAAADTDMSLWGTYGADVAAFGEITVDARQLFDVARALGHDAVELGLGANNWLELKCGSGRFRLAGLAPDDFPPRIQLEASSQVALPTAAFVQMVDRTLFCVSTDESRLNLGGVLYETPELDVLRMVSTDGHRLAMVEQHFDVSLPVPRGAIVARKGLTQLRRLVGPGQVPEFVRLGFVDHAAVFSVGELTLTSRLLEGQFPNYRQVIPEAGDNRAVVDTAALTEVLRRVALLAHGRARGVRFSFAPDTLELTADDPDHGTAHESLDVVFTGNPTTIGFNAQYILDVLGHIAQPKLIITFADDLSPAVLRPSHDAHFVAVVMPMRI